MAEPDRLQRAKRAYSEACAAYLRGHPDAERLCTDALRELAAARAAAEAERRLPLRRVPGGRR